MMQQAIRLLDSSKISELSRFVRSLKYRLNRKILGGDNEELAYWNDYNAHIEEAIRIVGEDEVRITNFITDHDGFGLHTAK